MGTNTVPNPYERIDALEQESRHQAGQIAILAAAVAGQALTITALLTSLGESAESLPGENLAPLGADRKRHGPTKAN